MAKKLIQGLRSLGSGFLINPGHMAIENRIYMENWVNTLFDSSEMAKKCTQRLRSLGSGFSINPEHMAIENRIYMENLVNTLFDSSDMAQRLRNGQKAYLGTQKSGVWIFNKPWTYGHRKQDLHGKLGQHTFSQLRNG